MTEERHAILVIDDDPGLCRVVERILQGDFDVETAPSTALARKHAAARRFRIVLLDLSLHDSLGLARTLKEDDPEVQVVLFTGKPISPAERAMVDGWIEKPTGPAEIRRVIAELLG